jgi:phosphoribosylformimino-5-aminoimidazole carboxamide ribonucleotide (ProFAR) isomerase
VGGGIRSLEDLDRVMRWGASRAILGTAAVDDVSFVSRAVEEYAEHVVVAVDVRGGRAMRSGWQEEGPPIDELIPALSDAGVPRLLVTSIARDGTLEGPDLTLYRRVMSLTDRPVIASGGVRSAEDVWALRDAGCEAAIAGKALYERRLKLSQVTRGGGVRS